VRESSSEVDTSSLWWEGLMKKLRFEPGGWSEKDADFIVRSLSLSRALFRHFVGGLRYQTCFHTRNSSADEIGERYRLNHVIVVKLYNPCTQFPRNVRLAYRRIAIFSTHRDFSIIVPYKYTYLLTD